MTAFDKRLRAFDREVAANVAREGWHLTGVFPTVDQLGPSFCYTTGLFKTYKHPELVVFGLQPQVAHAIIADLIGRIKTGHVFQDGERLEGAVPNGYSLFFRSAPVEDAECPQMVSKRFYRHTDFPSLQIVLPDTQNRFPWEDGCEEKMVLTQQMYVRAQEAREARS